MEIYAKFRYGCGLPLELLITESIHFLGESNEDSQKICIQILMKFLVHIELFASKYDIYNFQICT